MNALQKVTFIIFNIGSGKSELLFIRVQTVSEINFFSRSKAVFDKYMVACYHYGKELTNLDIHPMGITSIYLASKFEDVFPLHSKIVS